MPHRRNKLISLTLCLFLLLEQSGFAQSVSLNLSNYLSQSSSKPAISDTFRPLHLRYLSYDSQSNDFKLLLDKGDVFKGLSPQGTVPDNRLEQATQTLLKYFFIGLILPNDKFWVNLRPDSPDDILDDDLAKTDIGRIFLEADVQLKKDTAGLTSPQTKEGKEYWDKLYKKAGELFGSENITIPTLTRPWIVPDEVILRESPEGAYIYKATLKVMLEEDYLSRGGSRTAPTSGRSRTAPTMRTALTYQQYTFSDPRLKELNEYSTQLIKESIIPRLTQAVNTSRRYAPLRQVYYSLILAQWFKARYRSPGSQLTVDSSQNPYIKLIDSGNLTWNTPTNNSSLITYNFSLITKHLYSKDVYFQQYQQSFKDGEYSLQEPVYTPMGQSIRRYMSGGIKVSPISEVVAKVPANESFFQKTKLFLSPFLMAITVTGSLLMSSASAEGQAVGKDLENTLKDGSFASSAAESGLGVLEIENAAAVSSSIGEFPVINLLMNYLGNGWIKERVLKGRKISLDQWSIPSDLLPKVSDIVMWFPSRLARQIQDPVKLKNGRLPYNLGGIACREFVKIDFNKSTSYEQLAHVIWHELIHEFSFLSLREGKPVLPVRAWKKIAKEAGFYGALVGDRLVAVENLPEDYALWEKLGYGDWVYNENGGLYCYVQKERYEKLKKAARYDTNGITLREYNEYWKTTPFESVAEAGAAYLSNSDYANDGVSRFGRVARMVSNTLFAVQEADGSMWKYEFNRKNSKKLIRMMTAEEISEWKALHGVLMPGINVSDQQEIYLKPYSQVRLPYKGPMQLTLVPNSSDNKVELGVYSFQDLPARYKNMEGLGKETSFFVLETGPGLAGYKELKSGETVIIGRENAGNFMLNGFVSGRHVTIKNDGGGYVIFEDQNSSNKTKVVSSSMNLEKEPKDLGGIDLSRINKSIRTESVSSPGAGGGGSPVDVDFNVNEELIQLQKLLNAQIIPSADRLERYARAARASFASSPESADSIISLVAETFRLQEEKAVPDRVGDDRDRPLQELAAWLEQET